MKNTKSKVLTSLSQIPGGNSTRRRNQESRPVKASCRLVTMLFNHHTGAPFSNVVSPELDGYLPSERALLIVGISGVNPIDGLPLRRMAVYSYKEGEALLRFPVNFDPETGDVKLTGDKSPRQAEYAAINWMQGILFNNTLAAGTYDLAQRLGGTEMPRRIDFAGERTVESAVDMAFRYLEHTAPDGDHVGPVPAILPLITAEVLPGNSMRGVPAVELLMTQESYRAHATDRFVLGLNRTDANGFTALKRGFIRQFEVADHAISAAQTDIHNGHETLMRICESSTGLGSSDIEDGEQGVTKCALAYLEQLNLNDKYATESVNVVIEAVKMLQNYFMNRTEDGRVIMYAPAPDGGSHDCFRKPSCFSVEGNPVSITDGYLSDFRFPYNAKDLLG